jgi:hypothetical protein
VTKEQIGETSKWTRRLAVVGILVSLAAVTFIVTVNVVFLLNGRPGQAVFALLPIFLVINLSGVGGLLIVRRPGNPIGALLLSAGVLTAVSWGGGYYTELDDFLGAGRLPFVVPFAWLTGWIFTPTLGLMFIFVPMLYPTGHLPGPRWRILAGVAIVAISIGVLATATAPMIDTMGNSDTITNPIAPPQPWSDLIQALGSLSLLFAPPVILIVWANLVARFRRSWGVERQQMKWFLSVATVAAIGTSISIVTGGPVSDASWIIGMISIGLLPLAIGVAILRYRLYEIDRIVSRTVAYGVVTAVLVVTFAGISLALEAALASTTQASTLAVAVSTLAVFALFQPLRRRVQSAVDRRFDRYRFEADRTAAEFAERLRDEVDPDRIRLELDRVLAQTVAPTSAIVWLRGERVAEAGRGG